MPRITVELTPDEHRSLKLLCIIENKKLGVVLKEAIHGHLLMKDAHNLEVTGKHDLDAAAREPITPAPRGH